MRARRLSVHDLEPPQPLQRVLAALPTLAADEYLHVHHRREPRPLYDLLPSLGFRHRTRPAQDGGFHILIWRGDGPEPDADA